ncbi:MAG: aspartate--tRNA ligase [Deltaproteobacteria bacterium GWA2_55_10]|nr:MAG: aspartate--tRNA ligase [Deltaproteobacteria bacterium GWA2_55_10]
MLEKMGSWRRTSYCGEPASADIGKKICLMGWVQRRRDHGGLIFIDLRDRAGIIQLVFSPESLNNVHAKAHDLRNEFVVAVEGLVRKRPDGTENQNLPTGQVEIEVHEIRVLNDSETLPFMIEDDSDVAETTRLTYRYLDLRRPALQKKLMLRHKVAMATRNYLAENGFIEVETPVLTKSTPEGARDFLVPSRLNAGHFFALPQSPQLFKQILMISGFDRYFQVVKCFRDEDLRADRQPEFTQIDAEMSFVDREDVISVMEGLVVRMFNETGVKLNPPFPRLTYAEAVGRFGVDNPDVRFGLELKDLTRDLSGSGFKVFADAAAKGGVVKAICVPGGGAFSRKDLDDLTEVAVSFGAKGLAWVKITDEGWQSPIAKFLSDAEKDAIAKATGAVKGDLLLFGADKAAIANTVLGRLRLNIGNRLGLIPKDVLNFVWVTDFPMFEYDEAEKRHVAVHHPFTSPMDEDLDKLESAPLTVRAKAYDLVLNGSEIGGGSIRIHRSDVQSRVFEMLGIKSDEAHSRFGFLLDALKFGTPPHGGIAFGLDRVLSIMTASDSIRDVIAFPKTQKGTDLMTDAPSVVDQKQLDELFIRVAKKQSVAPSSTGA